MERGEDWKGLAIEKQLQFIETLGSRPYDEIEKSNLFLLKKKIGFATCGKPSELPSSSNFFTGYTKDELEHIKPICEKIIEKSDADPIRFACTILILYHKEALCETPVFRIVNKDSSNIFIDAHSRVYLTWEHFMEQNKLPDCEYCFPLNGVYSNLKEESLIAFAKSPASGLASKAADCLDTAGSVASVAAAGVFAAGLVISVAPALITAAGTTAACTGVYSVSRGISSLVDRNKHEQSVGLQDPESRSAWLSVGSSILGIATFGALGKAKEVVESGESLSKLSVFGLHALNASSLVFSGFGFVENLFICVDKYNKGILTKKDVFDLSCELLFLFNAIASVKATTNLVNSMSTVVSENPSAQRKLTKTQKRNLRKRAAKRRAKGLTPYNTVNETTQSSNSLGTSTAVQLLLFEAVKAYAPRLEEIMFNCQSIGHDIMSWKTGEMDVVVLLRNLFRNTVRLYNDYKDEVDEAITKVVKYFSSLSLNRVMDDIFILFASASEELKSFFCTKVINMEDQMDTLINDAEREILELHEQLGLDNLDNTAEDSPENDDDDDGLNPETQTLLAGCGNVVSTSSVPCKDLQDFGDIIDGVKYVIVNDFKTKVSDYKKTLGAAKSASGESFDIKKFHEALGINGDVGQYMFNEALKKITAEVTIFKIKTKCKEIKKEKSNRTTPIWEVLADGMFHYYGPNGTGDLSKPEMLSVVSGIVNIPLTEGNCKLFENLDVTMIEVLEQPKVHVVVYSGITESNTASGIIVVVK